MKSIAPTVEISIVVAAYDEEENVGRLHTEVEQALGGESFELLIVDDGSHDQTAARVQDLALGDPRVRLIRLARNYGVQAAYLAGMRAARGRAIITLDCDLQHPPSLLPSMIQRWREGARIIVMRRKGYERTGRLRLWASRLYASFVQFLSDDPFAGEIGDFLLLDRRARNRLFRRLPPRPYWRTRVPWLGYPLHFISYHVAPRYSGVSRFGFNRLLGLALDGILASSTRPLRLSFHLGLITIAVVSIYAFIVVVAWLRGHSAPGYPTLIITVALLGSIQLIGLGIIGEYLGRVYDQTRCVPAFVVLDNDLVRPTRKCAGCGTDELSRSTPTSSVTALIAPSR
jgi:glycosyltransferase involved in cell wall biosynthesis